MCGIGNEPTYTLALALPLFGPLIAGAAALSAAAMELWRRRARAAVLRAGERPGWRARVISLDPLVIHDGREQVRAEGRYIVVRDGYATPASTTTRALEPGDEVEVIAEVRRRGFAGGSYRDAAEPDATLEDVGGHPPIVIAGWPVLASELRANVYITFATFMLLMAAGICGAVLSS
jgi:hypothetical protein